MKRLTFAKAHRLDQLGGELFAAFPGWRHAGPAGLATTDVQIESAGDQIAVTVPDDTSEAAVAAVVEGHAPRKAAIAPPVDLVRPIVTGSRSDGTALASLLRRLQQAGIVEDKSHP